ncbi:hypothetical protein XENOCAPTIV_028744 [Xenoophorus captivus]|uniref:SHQ1-like CS domain-containing protein n=1 Tax=Xenoophorus captivus TaxID=1517983 RepID=A0ABV0RW72_9TELE
MITPAFDLRQDPDHLTICIRAPYTRTSEFDLFIDGTDFKFYAKPYFLRSSVLVIILLLCYVAVGVFTLKVPKETPGEHFEGLQMLTSLLAPKGSRSAKPLVEDARLEAEALAFSSDHYLADLFEDDEMNRLLKFTPWWSKLSPSTEQEEESGAPTGYSGSVRRGLT